MNRRHVGYLVLFSFTAVLSMVMALGAMTSLAFSDRVLPRTMVAGVEIGRLTYPEAQAKVAEQASQLNALKVTFTVKDKSANVSLVDLGVTVDQQAVLSQVIRPSDAFDWVKPSYWGSIFRSKSIAFGFRSDKDALRKKVETALGVTTAAQDASLSYENGALVVHEGQKGTSVSDSAIAAAVQTVLTTGSPTEATLSFAETDPVITTEIATQTKTEVMNQLSPVHLGYSGQNFTITPASESGFLDFSTSNDKITWQVSASKIRDYLNTVIAPKVNVKMLPKTTKADTGEVTQAGRDGQQMNVSQLASDIARTITAHTDTTSSPIAIAVTAVPFTEKTIYPEYVAGLFPGVYADVNLTTQHMYILNGTTLVASYLVSTGQAGLRTPPGQFYVCNKITLARSPLYKSLWMPLWNALSTSPTSCAGYLGYGVHGLPCFNSTCTLAESPLHLGRPVSHGCVRLPDDGARWFYDNMPTGTPVNIHYSS